MKMTKDEAFLAVATYRRDRAVEEIQSKIVRAQEELTRIRNLEGDDLVGQFAVLVPDRAKDGVYDCGSGCWVSDAREAAGMLADLTGNAISYMFSGHLHTEYPRPKLT